MNEISRAKFVLMVVNHFENRRFNPDDPWTVEDSFTHIAEEVDLSDMPPSEWNKLIVDCKLFTNNYLKVGG